MKQNIFQIHLVAKFSARTSKKTFANWSFVSLWFRMTCQTSATVFLLFSTNPLKIILSAITCVSKLTRGPIKKNKTCVVIFKMIQNKSMKKSSSGIYQIVANLLYKYILIQMIFLFNSFYLLFPFFFFYWNRNCFRQ